MVDLNSSFLREVGRERVVAAKRQVKRTTREYVQTAASELFSVVVVVILYCHDGPWPIRHIEL